MKQLLLLFAIALLCVPAWADEMQVQPTDMHPESPASCSFDQADWWPNEVMPADIIDNDTRTLEESLNTINGIEARTSGPAGIALRGGGPAQEVLRLYHGIPLAGLLDHSSLLLPQENLSRVEIFRTPQSVLFGNDVGGGAIDFEPQIENRPTVRLSSGNNMFPGFASIPVWTSDSDHLQMTADTQGDPSAYLNRYTLNGSQTWHKWTFEQSAVVGQSGELSDQAQRKDQLFSILMKRDLEQMQSFFIRSTAILENESFGTLSRSASAQTYLQSAGYSFPVNTVTTATLGADWRLQNLQTMNVAREAYHDNQLEVSGQLRMPVQDWQGHTGVRYLAAYGLFATDLGIVRDRQDKLWLTFSQGVRSPSLTDRYVTDDVYVANPALRTQIAQTIELGYLKRPAQFNYTREGFVYGGSFFSTQYMNRLDYDTTSGTYERINGGAASASGADFNAGYSHSIWTLEARGEYLQAQDSRTQHTLKLAPKFQATWAGSCQLGPVLAELRGLYWDKYLDQPLGSSQTVELGPWSTWDLNVRTMGFSQWAIRAGVLNIFNVARELSYGFPEPGREFYASVERSF